MKHIMEKRSARPAPGYWHNSCEANPRDLLFALNYKVSTEESNALRYYAAVYVIALIMRGRS